MLKQKIRVFLLMQCLGAQVFVYSSCKIIVNIYYEIAQLSFFGIYLQFSLSLYSKKQSALTKITSIKTNCFSSLDYSVKRSESTCVCTRVDEWPWARPAIRIKVESLSHFIILIVAIPNRFSFMLKIFNILNKSITSPFKMRF